MTEGDVLRVRVLDSDNEWCIGHIVLLSPNGQSIGLWTDESLRLGGGAVLMGFIPILIEDDKAYVAGFGIELEIERRKVQ